MPFHSQRLDIPDVIHIQPKIFPDSRGFFLEVFKITDFKEYGIRKPFVQVNHSRSERGVLRGLHYQMDPKAQGKLVSVIEGAVFDVAVDLRAGSPSYGRWVGETLDADKKNMLYVPEGFAHGFCVLSEFAQVIYYCTEVYAPEYERGVLWSDPELKIAWPVEDPVLSDKDSRLPPLGRADNTFSYPPPRHVGG